MADEPEDTRDPSELRADEKSAVRDILRIRLAIETGQVPPNIMDSWISGRLAQLQPMMERDSGVKIRLTTTVEDMPTIAWTEPGPDGVPIIKIKSKGILPYAQYPDETTQQPVVNISKVAAYLFGTVYHELGHVMFTPRIVDTLPEVNYFVRELVKSFRAWYEKLSLREQCEFGVATAILGQFMSSADVSAAKPMVTAVQPALYLATETIARIAKPWLDARLEGRPIIVGDPMATLDEPWKADVIKLRKDTDKSKRNAQMALTGLKVWTETAFSPGEHPPAWRDATGIYEAVTEEFRTKMLNIVPGQEEHIRYLLDGGARAKLDVASGQAAWIIFAGDNTISLWKWYNNALEDQKLEWQLSNAFAGLGSYFAFVALEFFDPAVRYILTAGRLFISQAERNKDRAYYHAVSRTDSKVMPVDGFEPYIEGIAKRYIGLDMSKHSDLEYGAYLTALDMVVHKLYSPGTESYPQTQYDIPELKPNELDEAPKKLKSGDFINKANEKQRGMEQVQKEKSERNLDRERAATLLGVARRVLARAGAIQTLRQRLSAAEGINGVRKAIEKREEGERMKGYEAEDTIRQQDREYRQRQKEAREARKAAREAKKAGEV